MKQHYKYQGAVTGRLTSGDTTVKDSPFRNRYQPPPFKVSDSAAQVTITTDFGKIEDRVLAFLSTGHIPQPPPTWPKT